MEIPNSHFRCRPSYNQRLLKLGLYKIVGEIDAGHRRSGVTITNSYGAGVGTIWLDDVGCSGWENSLDECTHNGWGVHDCAHVEDVAIECDPPTTPAAANGILLTHADLTALICMQIIPLHVVTALTD